MALAVADTPSIRIGFQPERDEETFGRPRETMVIDDSLVVIFNSMQNRAGLYSIEGRFIRWLMSEGEGPGELQAFWSGGVTPDGRVWAYDPMARRLTLVDLEGDVDREAVIPPNLLPLGVGVYPIGPAADGSWLLRVERPVWEAEVGTVYRMPTEIMRLTADDSTSVLWSGGGDVIIAGGSLDEDGVESGVFRGRHTPQLVLRASGDGAFLARSDSAVLHHVDLDGEVTTVGHFPWTPIPIERGELPPAPTVALEVKREIEEYYPSVSSILIDPDGDPWVLRAWAPEEDPPLAEWIRVADEEPLERVRPTTYIGILSAWIGHDWIPTIKTVRATGEQYVGLHRLRRPGEAGDG